MNVIRIFGYIILKYNIYFRKIFNFNKVNNINELIIFIENFSIYINI